MKIIKTQTALNIMLSVLCCLFVVSCQNSSQPQPGGAAPGPVSTNGPAETLGTGDGGGGNGAGGKVYEAYVVDPTQLEAFKKYLVPLFKDSKATASEKDAFNQWSGFFGSKTWYVAPVKLKPLPKESLGLSFTEDNTQQLAIQTSNSIWIDSGYFQKMSLEDQAQLILHEFVMSVYFLKFRKMSEMCVLSEKIIGTTSAKPCDTTLDEIFLPAPEMPLNSEDYDNIRYMTAWLWRNRGNANKDEIYLQFLLNGFDQRLFSSFIDSSKDPQNTQYPASLLTDLLEEAVLLNRGPTECTSLFLKEKIGCSLKITPGQINVGPVTAEGHGVEIQLANQSPGPVVKILNTQKVFISKMRDLITKEKLVLIPIADEFIKNPKKGDKYFYHFVVAKEIPSADTSKLNLKFHAWVSSPMVITKIEKRENFLLCSGDRPNPTTLNEDVLIASRPETNTTYLHWLAKNMAFGIVPCN